METRPHRPADCDLDYGGAFEMSAKGPAARICHGDTVMDGAARARLWRGVAARRVYVQVGAGGRNLLQRGAAGVFVSRGKQEIF